MPAFLLISILPTITVVMLLAGIILGLAGRIMQMRSAIPSWPIVAAAKKVVISQPITYRCGSGIRTFTISPFIYYSVATPYGVMMYDQETYLLYAARGADL
mgnify:CR=1 FL=1